MSLLRPYASPPWIALGALGAQLRRAVERSCFDFSGHLQAGPLLTTASGVAISPAAVPPDHSRPRPGGAKSRLTDVARRRPSPQGASGIRN